ncbi:MFS transporter [Pusillimonas sp. T2]|uniref:MDR family MFS transporter n=1 Tax=Pusillimonas sp. T2 TaxID=1548123 RepID=UPI000B9CE5FF|nr:MDR family MFS transporter [Pusillimonas sp. T2]OXR48472.1 MFS transporter [Pusillimonas sp. T2]
MSVTPSSTPAASQPTTLTDREIRKVVAGLMVAIILGGLEQTIVAVALPRMAADLQGVQWLAWVVSAYLIAVAVSTPIYGKLGDLYGRRAMLSSAIIIFLGASVLCAMASSMPMMIGARILQGIGGGGLLSVSQAIIADIVSPRERGRYQGYISVSFAIASVAGPIAGGLLTEYLSWHWIFWVNLPIGLAAYMISQRTLVRLSRPSIKRSVDVGGALLLTAGLTTLLIAISRVGHGTHILDSYNVTLAAIAVVFMAAFVWQEKRAAEPIIPLVLLANPIVAASCVLLFIAFIELIALTILIPLRLQMLTAAGADRAALQLVPLSVAIPAGAYIGGTLMARLGQYRNIQLVGASMVPVSMALTAYTDPTATGWVILFTTLAGIGIGLQLPTSTVAAQNAVAQRHIGVTTGLASFSRSVGAAVGIAILTAALFALLQSYMPATLTELSSAETVRQMIEGQLPPLSDAARAVLMSSGEKAFRHTFLISALIAAISVILCLRIPERALSEKRPSA